MTTLYPHLYRGTVVSDLRPAGKLTIQVPGATGTKAIVATSVAVLMGFDQTTQLPIWYRYDLPAKTGLWVMFEQGNPAKPVVIGLL